jgi:hypothetical protein
VFVLVVVVGVILLALVPLGHGVVRAEQRGQVGGRGQRAAGGSPGPVRQNAAALVEGVLRLGELLGLRHRRRRLGEAGEGLGLARVVAGEAAPGSNRSNMSSFYALFEAIMKQVSPCSTSPRSGGPISSWGSKLLFLQSKKVV